MAFEFSAPHTWFDSAYTPAAKAQDSVYDPNSGLYYNRVTGQFSSDPGGAAPVGTLDSAQQSARAVAISNALYGKLGEYGQQYTGAQQGQQALLQQLQGVVSGATPSVAQNQLQQGLGQIAAQQQSAASGVGGVNAALARTEAMKNTAQAQAQANQAASLLRANETAEARSQQGQVLGQQAGEANQASSTAIGGSNQASSIAEGNRQNQNALAASDEDFWANAVRAGGSAIASGASSGASSAAGK